MSPGIVLVAANSPSEQAVFDHLVHGGIEREQLSAFHPSSSGGLAHAWPILDADNIEQSSINRDDYVLFYRGGNHYTCAAKIREIDVDNSLADELHKHVVQRTEPNTQPQQEFSSTVLWLENPIPIDLDSYHLHDLIDLNQDALTRTIVPDQSRVTTITDEYGTLEDMITTFRESPSVFVEVTSVEGKPYKQAGGEFELGTSAFSRSSSSNGHDIYGTLREAEVGDLVVHILKDTREIRGVSMVSSTLQTDFEGPPGDSWDQDEQGNGYFLPLGGYIEFDDPVDIDTDFLKNEDYRESLREIYDDNAGLFYDKNFELAQGKYLTKAPMSLFYLILAELPNLYSTAKRYYWDISQPPAVDQYDTVNQAIVDVRTRIPFADTTRDWFLESFTTTVLEAFTDSLSSVEPGAELTETEATHCALIRQLYSDQESALTDAADRLNVGRTNQLNRPQTLFFVLFRELQDRVGALINIDQIKTQTILEENYEIEAPEIDITTDQRKPLEPREKPEQGDEIARQLAASGQMVFYGPPGTGKTYTAKRFAHWWLNEQSDVDPHTGQIETVTFHPSFTYEDFIEGLTVDSDSEGSVTYDEEPGVFLDFARQAKQDYYAAENEAPRYVLIIDEINRGNLAQIFGEMITGLEADKRLDQDNQTTVSLAHSGDPFTIPPNLYLIGTMNTADRSIALVDAALRRRFRFLSFPPKLRLLREEYSLDSWQDTVEEARRSSGPKHLLAKSLIAISILNSRIRSEPDLGRGKQIGHSFFFGIQIEDTDTRLVEEKIVDTWRFEILPLLEEYLFGQYERIRESLFVGDGDALFDWEHEQIKSFDAESLSTALEPFVDEFDDEPETVDD